LSPQPLLLSPCQRSPGVAARLGHLSVAGQNESPESPDLRRIATQVGLKRRARAGRKPGDAMSGHLRFGFAAFLLVAGFSTPAASNPLTDLFSPKPAPEAATAAPAPAPEECLRQPGTSTAPGQRWVYRYDGHRKCWFQAEEGTALAKKAVRRQAARQRVAAPEENEAAPRRQKAEAVEAAHAELLSSSPAETPQSTPPSPTLKMVHTVRVTDAAAMVPPAPLLDRPASDQPTPDQPTSRRVDVEKLLAESPAASDEVASAPAATRAAGLSATMGDWIIPRLGVLLIALGLLAVLSSSRTLRRALWPVRFPDSVRELSDIVYNGRNDLSIDRIAAHRPAPHATEFPGDWVEALRALESLSRGAAARKPVRLIT
jgi:hypothetical protein